MWLKHCNFAQKKMDIEQIHVTMTRRGLVMDANAEELAMSLKTYRLRQDLTQEQLGKILGCSRWTIIRLEQCKRVRWETTYRIYNRLVQELAKEAQQ